MDATKHHPISAWAPNPSDLERLTQLLRESQIPDKERQRKIYSELTELSKNSEFYLYLVYLLSDVSKELSVRQVAGLTLKSHLDRNFDSISEEVKSFLRAYLLQSFNSPPNEVRKLSSLVITNYISKGGFQSWPDLLDFLIANLNSSNEETIEMTIDCISKIVEDLRVNSENYVYFDTSKGGQSLDVLVPILLVFCSPQYNTRIRAVAIFCLNLCIFTMPPALSSNIHIFLDTLIQATGDADKTIRLRAFQGLVALNETKKDIIMKRKNDVFTVVIRGTGDQEYDVAKNASLFWPEFLARDPDESMERVLELRPALPVLLPILIKNLRYTELDLANILPESDSFSGKFSGGYSGASGEDFEVDGSADLDDDDHQKKDFFDHGEYTLRRITGQTFEKLTTIFRDELFNLIHSIIEMFLTKPRDWMDLEAAILCLGTLSEGCFETIKPFLNNLVPLFFQHINHPESLIRSTSLWTMSKYSNWIIEMIDPQNENELLKTYLRLILERITENHHVVQDSACTSFTELINKAAHLLYPYIYDVVNVIVAVLDNYKGNLYNIYGAISSIAESLDDKLQDPSLINLLIPPLEKKWQLTAADDKSLCGLLECVVSVACAMGKCFEPFCEFFFPKGFQALENYVLLVKSGEKKSEYEKKEILLRSIDLFSTIVDILKENFQLLLIKSNKTSFFDLIGELIEDKEFQVRQFIASLIGDLSSNCPTTYQPFVSKHVPLLIKNIFLIPSELDPGLSFMAVCNNSVWTLGDLSVTYPSLVAPFAYKIAIKIIEFFTTTKMPKSLGENLAKALGRLALLDPQNISQNLPSFFRNWCLALRVCKEDPAKHQAFKGMFLMLNQSFDSVSFEFQFFCEAFGNFENPDAELKQAFSNLIQYIKNLRGEEWNEFLRRLPMHTQTVMKKHYGA